MAIITCPECNEKISSTAKQCIHCGASLVICPECETVFVKGTKVCAECGYTFVEKEREENTNTENSELTKKSLTAGEIKKEANKDNSKITFLEILGYLSPFASVALIIWAFLKLKNWSDGSVEMVENYKSVQSDVTTMIVLSAILMVLTVVLDVINEKNEIQRIIDFSRNKKLKLNEVIANTLSLDFSQINSDAVDDHAEALVSVVNSEIYDKDSSARNRFNMWVTVKIASALIFGLCLFLFVKHNMEIYMDAEIFKSDMLNIPGFSIDSIERWWLFGVMFIAESVKNIFVSKTKKASVKGRRNWIKKNFPESLEAYDRYLDGFYSARKYGEDISKNSTHGGV